MMSIKEMVLEAAAKIGPTRTRKLQEVVANWSGLQEYMSEMTPSKVDLESLLAMIDMELKSEKPRPYIVDRLYMRFSNLRRDCERADLPILEEKSNA